MESIGLIELCAFEYTADTDTFSIRHVLYTQSLTGRLADRRRTLLTASALKPLYAEVFAVVSVAGPIEQFSSSWRNPISRCSNVF